MSGIRVTYSGLIGFAVSSISVLTGLVFILIVTRTLTAEEFGTWGLIGNVIGYFLVAEGIFTFWTTRQIARGEKIGKTALISSSIFSIFAIPIYIITIYVISDQSNAILDSMLLGIILVPILIISTLITSINFGFRPQAVSYSLLIFGAIKILAVLALVYFLDWGLDGAIIALIIAYSIRIVFQLYFAKSQLRDKFSLSVLKRWLKLSWLSSYSTFPGVIALLDMIIYPIITGSVIGLAIFSASNAIANIISHSAKVSEALYPKILEKPNNKIVIENLGLFMFFSIPLLGVSIIFSKPALFALNPIYSEAWPVVIILSFKTFFLVLNNIFTSIMVGLEKVDTEKNLLFSDFVKSKLFFIPTLRYIKFFSYIAILSSVLILLSFEDYAELDLVIYWVSIGLIIEFPFFIILLTLLKKEIKFYFEKKPIIRYSLASLAFIFVYYLTSESIIVYHESIFQFLPGLFFQLTICVLVYVGITYMIDKKTRNLVKKIFHELKF